jgi:2,4-dienoyl-CoA reductase-like NADH-dependent reductase (Old Yellow Enzyme family)
MPWFCKSGAEGKEMKRLALAILAVSALVGCKASTSEPTKAEAPKVETAEQAVKALLGAGLPVADIKVITPETDENNMMGRPGGYTSKAYFADTRHPPTQDKLVIVENNIEGFSSEDDAQRRADYVTEIAKSMPMMAQYVYRSGKFVLRLDRALLPDQAKAYEAALAKVTG